MTKKFKAKKYGFFLIKLLLKYILNDIINNNKCFGIIKYLNIITLLIVKFIIS